MKYLLTIIIIGLVGYGAYKIYDRNTPTESEQTICTLDAKVCPDGSYVGRQGPECKFAECPGEANLSDWQVATETPNMVSYKFPKNISSTYISSVDWPPKLQIIKEGFSCTQAGNETGRAGITELKKINGTDYCVTRVSEGAAGSTYIQYAYKKSSNNGSVYILTFSLRFPQCANYPESNIEECQVEQSFNVDNLIDQIFSTFI